MAQYDEWGREIPDPRPVTVPHNWSRPLSLQEQIKRFIRSEKFQAELDGEETFEEADDFDVDEDPDPLSMYEMPEAAPEAPGGVKDVDPDPPITPAEKTPKRAAKASQGDSSESEPE